MNEEIELVEQDYSPINKEGDEVGINMESYLKYSGTPIREICESIQVRRELNNNRLPSLAFLDKWKTTTNYVKNTSDSFLQGFQPWDSHIEIVEAKFGSGTGSYFRSLRRLFCLNVFIFILSFGLILGPQLAYDIINDNAPSRPFSILNGIIGGGYLTDTIMFYGHYNESIVFPNGSVFSTSYVYFYSTMSLYLVSVLYISISMARLYRKNFIDYVVSLDAHHFFTNHVLCGWDGEIKNNSDSTLRKEKIASLLKESFENKMSHSHRLYKHLDKNLLAKRIVIHIIIISILLSAGALTYFAIDIIEDKLSFGSSLRQILLNFGISVALYVLPLSFMYLTKLEQYELPRTAMYVSLIRSVILEKIFLITIFVKSVEKAMNEESCWESFVGKAIYQLAVAYVLILLLGTFVMELLHRILNSIFNKIPPPDFDTSRNSTHLIYSQSIALIGYYFVPGISLFMIFSSMLTFYVKLLSLRFNCSKSKTPWRAARSQTVFMVYAFFSTLISVIGYIFVVIRLQPSIGCGPFKEYKYSYTIMGEDSFFRDSFIFKPAFIIGLIVILLVSIYYTQSLNRTYVIETKKLKENINRQKVERRILKNLLASL